MRGSLSYRILGQLFGALTEGITGERFTGGGLTSGQCVGGNPARIDRRSNVDALVIELDGRLAPLPGTRFDLSEVADKIEARARRMDLTIRKRKVKTGQSCGVPGLPVADQVYLYFTLGLPEGEYRWDLAAIDFTTPWEGGVVTHGDGPIGEIEVKLLAHGDGYLWVKDGDRVRPFDNAEGLRILFTEEEKLEMIRAKEAARLAPASANGMKNRLQLIKDEQCFEAARRACQSWLGKRDATWGTEPLPEYATPEDMSRVNDVLQALGN